jgi:hypothetical protein
MIEPGAQTNQKKVNDYKSKNFLVEGSYNKKQERKKIKRCLMFLK